MSQKLTPENYQCGFLIDHEWMGGIAPHPDDSTRYISYIVQIESAESLQYNEHLNAQEAIQHLNQVPRDWSFATTKECGDGACNPENCEKGDCQVKISV